MFLKDSVMMEGYHSQVDAVDQHGRTPSLGVCPHHGTVLVVQEPTLAWEGK